MASSQRVHKTCAVPGATTLVAAIASCLFLTGCPFAMNDDFYIAQGDAGGVTLNANEGDGSPGSLQVCGATSPNKCGSGVCSPFTCVGLGFNCGSAANGCGGVLQCGTCPAGQRCGAASLNRCGCIPSTCDKLGAQCGAVGDGCGGMLNCGSCKGNMVCGAKSPNHCDKPGM